MYIEFYVLEYNYLTITLPISLHLKRKVLFFKGRKFLFLNRLRKQKNLKHKHVLWKNAPKYLINF